MPLARALARIGRGLFRSGGRAGRALARGALKGVSRVPRLAPAGLRAGRQMLRRAMRPTQALPAEFEAALPYSPGRGSLAVAGSPALRPPDPSRELLQAAGRVFRRTTAAGDRLMRTMAGRHADDPMRARDLLKSLVFTRYPGLTRPVEMPAARLRELYPTRLARWKYHLGRMNPFVRKDPRVLDRTRQALQTGSTLATVLGLGAGVYNIPRALRESAGMAAMNTVPVPAYGFRLDDESPMLYERVRQAGREHAAEYWKALAYTLTHDDPGSRVARATVLRDWRNTMRGSIYGYVQARRNGSLWDKIRYYSSYRTPAGYLLHKWLERAAQPYDQSTLWRHAAEAARMELKDLQPLPGEQLEAYWKRNGKALQQLKRHPYLKFLRHAVVDPITAMRRSDPQRFDSDAVFRSLEYYGAPSEVATGLVNLVYGVPSSAAFNFGQALMLDDGNVSHPLYKEYDSWVPRDADGNYLAHGWFAGPASAVYESINKKDPRFLLATVPWFYSPEGRRYYRDLLKKYPKRSSRWLDYLKTDPTARRDAQRSLKLMRAWLKQPWEPRDVAVGRRWLEANPDVRRRLEASPAYRRWKKRLQAAGSGIARVGRAIGHSPAYISAVNQLNLENILKVNQFLQDHPDVLPTLQALRHLQPGSTRDLQTLIKKNPQLAAILQKSPWFGDVQKAQQFLTEHPQVLKTPKSPEKLQAFLRRPLPTDLRSLNTYRQALNTLKSSHLYEVFRRKTGFSGEKGMQAFLGLMDKLQADPRLRAALQQRFPGEWEKLQNAATALRAWRKLQQFRQNPGVFRFLRGLPSPQNTLHFGR